MSDQRITPDRRDSGRPGRRASDEIFDLHTHPAACVNLAQLAKYWGVHNWTIRSWARKGKIAGVFKTPGGEWRVRREDALAFEASIYPPKEPAA